MKLSDRQLQRRDPAFEVAHIGGKAVQALIDAGELDPEKVEHFSVGYHARAYKGLV
jgi:hypothetical protein